MKLDYAPMIVDTVAEIEAKNRDKKAWAEKEAEFAAKDEAEKINEVAALKEAVVKFEKSLLPKSPTNPVTKTMRRFLDVMDEVDREHLKRKADVKALMEGTMTWDEVVNGVNEPTAEPVEEKSVMDRFERSVGHRLWGYWGD